MEATAFAPTSTVGAAGTAGAQRGFEELSGDAFFKLLIAQLSNQDPLEPTSNQELLQQISSIRDIELSTALTGSLRSLVDQQRVGSGAALIGQYVTGLPAATENGALPPAGVVVGIRFAEDGSAVLMLQGGGELPLDQVGQVMPAGMAAEQMRGRHVTGLDRSDPDNPELIDGIVTGVRTESGQDVVLELDHGGEVRLTDVLYTGEESWD